MINNYKIVCTIRSGYVYKLTQRIQMYLVLEIRSGCVFRIIMRNNC